MSEDECDSPGMMQLKGIPSHQGNQPRGRRKFTPDVWAPKFETSNNETSTTLQMACQGVAWFTLMICDNRDNCVVGITNPVGIGWGTPKTNCIFANIFQLGKMPDFLFFQDDPIFPLEDNFLDCWNFFTTADPTHGYVQYVSEEEAKDLNLFRITSASSVYLGNLEQVWLRSGTRFLRFCNPRFDGQHSFLMKHRSNTVD